MNNTKEDVIMHKRIVAVMLAVFMLMGIFSGCIKGEKYNVDYGGAKWLYKNAKDSYFAGQKVKLYFDMIATDTDYSFYLDGEKLNFDYDERKGFIIEFVMPGHDVKLEFETVNSMEYAESYESGTVLIDYSSKETGVPTNSPDSYYALVLQATDDPYTHELSVYDDGVCRVYSVSCYAYTDCYEIITVNGVDKWSTLENGASLDGTVITLKFFDGEKLQSVSSDNMHGEDGEVLLSVIRSTLQDYINEANFIGEKKL